MTTVKPKKCRGLKNPARPCGLSFFGAGRLCPRCRGGKYYAHYKSQGGPKA